MAVLEFVEQRPCAALHDAIGSYAGYFESGTQPTLHRGLPSGRLTFIVTVDDPCHIVEQPDASQSPGRFRAFVSGLHATPALVSHQGYQHGIQLDLSPMAARSLLGLPASALPAATVELEDLIGDAGRELWERVASATGWRERFDVLDRQFSKRMLATDASEVAPELGRAWALLERSDGALTINELAADVGWSRRHLSQQFRSEFGLSPKVVARMLRFDRARHLLQTGRHSIADVAAEMGYADQAHMTREFNEFSGCSPGQWLVLEHPEALYDDHRAKSIA